MYDEEIEKAVLYYIIFQKAEYQIEEQDFIGGRNKLIARAINQLRKEKKEISMLTVQALIQGNQTEILKYISNLGNNIYGADEDKIYTKLIQLSEKRKVFDLLQKAILEIQEEEADIYSQKLIKKLNEITEREGKEKTFIEKLADATEDLEKKYNNQSDYSLYTGLYDLDDLTCGLHNQELTIIGARPGVGKTTLALQIAQNIAKKNKNVLFVSLEMSDNQLIQKMIARNGNVQSYRMRRGTLENSDWEKITESIGKLSELKFNTNSTIRNIQSLEVLVRKLKNQNKLDLLIIDYIQLLRNKEKFNSREQEVADISRRLKLISLELNIPIIALCQLNRNASNNEPGLSDLRESGSLEQDADNIIFLYKENIESEEITLKLAKQRAGATGKIRLIFKNNTSNFLNLRMC